MTLEHPLNPTKRFVPALLPWILAVGCLLIYLLTLNHWVSFGSLFQVAKASGWTWRPEVSQPLNWLVTSVCHLLPPKLIPLVLNLFSAVCAALTLALLARSVALLPQDRTEEQRQREKSPFSLLSIRLAWLPVLLAVLLCGLQLTFWEHATAASSEILDLLLFAYTLRCLLEFRIDERDSWLYRASLCCGLAMTDNWAMIGFFPAVLLALVWLKGLGFFNVRFLTRMFLWGLAGLSLYFLLPLVQSLSNASSLSFWQTLKANVAEQKSFLFLLPFSKNALLRGFADRPLWVLGLPSLLPVLVMGIRWPSYFGDPSKLGVALTTLIFHLFHAFLLFICTWVALDPQVSPRHLLPGIPMLTLYYLGALSVGYYSGYFLLVFRPRPGSRQRPSPLSRLINTASTGAVWLLLFTATALLVYRNLPEIRLTNGPLLRQFASLQTHTLPTRNAVLLSDEPRTLFLIQAAVTQDGSSHRFIFLDTNFLPAPDYHRFLKQKYPQRWLTDSPTNRTEQVSDIALIQALAKLEKTNELVYLHPSFGYYFEVFYLEPHGLSYKLKSFALNTLLPPVPDSQLIAENEDFWANTASPALKPLLAALAPPAPTENPAPLHLAFDWLVSRLHLAKNQSSEPALLGASYSRALNFWGVQLQRAGHLPQASAHFNQALDLNPDNRSALANRAANSDLQAGRRLIVLDTKSLEERFGKYRSWEPLMSDNGPFDEPTLCFEQGRAFAVNGNIRQAAELFTRTKALAPDHLPARLWLAQVCNTAGSPDQALGMIQEIHTNPTLSASSAPYQKEMLLVETSAYLAKHDFTLADAAVRTVLEKAPNDQDLLASATQVYMGFKSYSNALDTVERQLQLSPTNQSLLVNKGWLFLQLSAYDKALPPLTRVLDLETNSNSELYNSALLNRAIVYLRAGRLDASQRDYEALQKNYPTACQVYYGLGEIAYQKKDTNAAIRSYQLYLTNSPPGNTETNFIIARLKELKPGPP